MRNRRRMGKLARLDPKICRAFPIGSFRHVARLQCSARKEAGNENELSTQGHIAHYGGDTFSRNTMVPRKSRPI
jgi:hypothetical protein